MNQNDAVPACLTRDNLTSPYFPQTSLATFAAVIALCAVFMLTGFNRLNHTDLWGHVNFGRWMAEHDALPATDPLAAHPAAEPVLQAAWLSQRLAYETLRFAGPEGLALAHALLVTLAAGVLMLAVVRRGAPAGWAWAAGIAMFLLDLPIVGTIRPQLFGQLGAALFLLACAELPRRKHPLLWLPVVATLWANLHGSILMGIAILGLYAAGTTWNLWREPGQSVGKLLRDQRLLTVWSALLLVLAGASINPHGPALLPRILFFGEHAALASIMEWSALRPGSLTGVLMIASVLATVALVKFSPRKWEAYEIALLLVFGLLTLTAIRMLAWWAIVWPWVAVPHLAATWQAWQAKRGGEPAVELDQPNSMRTLMAMGFVFMTAIVAPPSYSLVTGRARGDAQILGSETPIYVADEMARRGLAGSIAAPMDWADYLVFQSTGRLKPLVHTHVHLSHTQTWRDYQRLFGGDARWLDILRQQEMQYVLVSRQRYPELARRVLMEDRSGAGGARIVYQDQRCLLAEVQYKPEASAREQY
jgi:hypothetical protein